MAHSNPSIPSRRTTSRRGGRRRKRVGWHKARSGKARTFPARSFGPTLIVDGRCGRGSAVRHDGDAAIVGLDLLVRAWRIRVADRALAPMAAAAIRSRSRFEYPGTTPQRSTWAAMPHPKSRATFCCQLRCARLMVPVSPRNARHAGG